MAHDPVAFKKTKHIMRESNYLRDLVARRVYSPEYVVSAQQLADILTKALPRLTFVRLRDMLLLLATVGSVALRLKAPMADDHGRLRVGTPEDLR